MLVLACFCALVQQSTGALLVLQNMSEYNPALSMPVSSYTDAFPRSPAPTIVATTRITVPREAGQCNNLTVDLGLVRTVGSQQHAPTSVSMWLWSTSSPSNPGSTSPVTFANTHDLVWSANLSVPYTLRRLTTIGDHVETHRFTLPIFPLTLNYTRAYWLGVTVHIARSYSLTNNTFNSVRWLVANASIPVSRLLTTSIYRIVDRFGNAEPAHRSLINWTLPTVAEPWLLHPPGSTSGTHRLAAYIVGVCTGVSVDPALDITATGLPPPYAPPQPPVPSPSPVVVVVTPTPTPTPTVVSSEQAGTPTNGTASSATTPTPTDTNTSPTPTVSQVTSTPTTMNVGPTPTVTQVAATPTPTPTHTGPTPTPTPPPVWIHASPTPTPMPTSVRPEVRSPSSWSSSDTSTVLVAGASPSPTPLGDAIVSLSTAASIGIFLTIAITMLLLLFALLYMYVRHRTNKAAYGRRIKRNEQKEFNEVHEMNSDAANIALTTDYKDGSTPYVDADGNVVDGESGSADDDDDDDATVNDAAGVSLHSDSDDEIKDRRTMIIIDSVSSAKK